MLRLTIYRKDAAPVSGIYSDTDAYFRIACAAALPGYQGFNVEAVTEAAQ